MRRLFEICTCMALALTATSCVRDEVVVVPALPSPSDVIAFGANLPDEATRSAEGGKTLDFSTFDASSEDGNFSLPMAIKVEEGISKHVADTRGAVVDSRDKLTSLMAWARLSSAGVAPELYIPGTAFEKNTTTGIFFPTGGESYLWPGEGKTLDFVTVSPANIEGFEPVFDAADATRVTEFHYTVPEDVADQPDILVATTSKSGNFGESVPLDFKHIMAAVNFKVGNVVAGTIQSITMKGVYDHGTYRITTGEWVDREVKGTNFSVPLPSGGLVVTEGSTDQQINNASTQAFMMIPQQPTTGAEIEIVFRDGTTGKTHTLRASIQGHVWGRNTTTNYMINIDGNYNLQIVPLDQLLDSHYIITKVEISSEYPSWILSASADDEAAVTVQLEDEVNPMAKQGFWTDKYATRVVDEWGTNADGNQVPKRFHYEFPENAESARGKDYIEGETMVSNKVVYVFVPENVSGKDRTITLKLSDGSNPLFGANKTIMLTQHSVKWLDSGDGNPDNYWGCELLIEGGKVPWGFCWDGVHMNFALVQGGFAPGKEGNIPPGQRTAIEIAMTNTGIDVDKLYNDTTYFVSLQKNKKGLWFIQIDFGKIGNIEIAQNLDDGYQNTYDIYGFDGITSIGSIIDFIVNWGKITDASTGDLVTDDSVIGLKNTLDYAAIYAMKRNRFYLYNDTLDGGEFNMPVLDVSKDLNWYLPAKDQFKKMVEWNANWGQQFTFNDLYWTSTSYFAEGSVDNAHSYAYINGVETIAHRNDTYHTMALRRKTHTADVVVNPEDVIVPGGGSNGPEYGEGGNTDNNQGGDIEGNN